MELQVGVSSGGSTMRQFLVSVWRILVCLLGYIFYNMKIEENRDRFGGGFLNSCFLG